MKQGMTERLSFIKAKTAGYILTCLGVLMGFNSMAQSREAVDYNSGLSLFSSPLFLVLLGVIILLVVFVAVFAGVLKDVIAVQQKEKKNNSGTISSIVALILLTASTSASANTGGRAEYIAQFIDIPTNVFYLMIGMIIFEIIIIIVLLSLIKLFIRKEVEVTEIVEEPSFLEVLNASVAVEEEEGIMLDHEYDGIKELDNELPPWWKYGFYLTIVFAFVYLINHHITETSPSQLEEFETSLENARIAKEEYQKMNANNVNENSVTMLTDEAEIEKGKKVYIEMCFACHGKYGEGGVGPNLTDEYWLHGGSIKDIFSSIKYGWPNKGMKSWQADMSPVQIHQISAFIKTLQGTNPTNPKAIQGELYVEEIIANDSLMNDSTLVIAPIDSMESIAQ